MNEKNIDKSIETKNKDYGLSTLFRTKIMRCQK